METKVLLKELEENGFRLAAGDPCLLMLSLNEVVAECVNRPLDIKRLQGILMAKGYRVASNDPVFLILTINKILLEDMVKQQQLEINKNAQSIFALPQQAIKPKKTSISLAWPIACSSLFLFAGWLLLEADKIPLSVFSVGVVLGVGLGVLGVLMMKESTAQVKNVSKSPYQLSTAQLWDEMDFNKMIKGYGRQKFGGSVDTQNQIALFDFFCKGASLERVSARHDLSLVGLSHYIDDLKKFKSSQPK